MMNLPMEFLFNNIAVRGLLVGSEPWFVASDIATALDYRDAEKITRWLDDDEKGTHIVGTLGGDQQMLIINESGLYSAILRSRKPEAKHFKKWVTAEVLPSLRRHGSYVMPATDPVPYEHTVTPMAAHSEVEQIISAGRVFRALFGTARSMGIARRLAATRANQATERATGIDLVAELGVTQWLDSPDLPAPQRKQYELQQRIREHLVAHDWPQNFSGQQLIEALTLINDKGTQMAVGQCLQLIGYKKKRLASATPNGFRPWVYVLGCAPAVGYTVS